MLLADAEFWQGTWSRGLRFLAAVSIEVLHCARKGKLGCEYLSTAQYVVSWYGECLKEVVKITTKSKVLFGSRLWTLVLQRNLLRRDAADIFTGFEILSSMNPKLLSTTTSLDLHSAHWYNLISLTYYPADTSFTVRTLIFPKFEIKLNISDWQHLIVWGFGSLAAFHHSMMNLWQW